MKNKRARGIVSACLITGLFCLAVFGTHMQNEKKGIEEMENVLVSNMLYGYVDALDVYASNLQVLAFEKESPAYIYRLHEALGLMKAGSDSLSRETYGDVLADGLSQSIRDLTRQLSGFTYRFAGKYPKQSTEMDSSLLEIAKQIRQASGSIDNALKHSSAEPWIRNPANEGEWMLYKGYILDDLSEDAVALEINRLIEENEIIMQKLEWE